MKSKGRITNTIALKDQHKKGFTRSEYLESIMSSMPDSLIVMNPDATLRSVNNATLALLGYTEAELIGNPATMLVLHEEPEISALHKCFQQITDSGAANNISLTYLTKQEKPIPVSFNGALMQQDKHTVGIVGVARDMRQTFEIISNLETNHKILEKNSTQLTRMQRAMLHMMDDLAIANKELQTANKELHALDLLKSDFVSTVSHELRTPLAITKEALSLILDEIPGHINQPQYTILHTAKSNIDRLANIITELLDISRIEAGKVEIKRAFVDIVPIVKQVVSGFEEQAKEKDLKLKTHLSASEIQAYVDPDKLIRIFTNLLHNAIKFTDKGSIAVSVKESNGTIECAVSDTGIGISQDNLPKVFHKYQQFGRAIAAADRGTGLGLAIVKGLIDTHNGSIRVESQLGKGTTFTFIIDTAHQSLTASIT